MTFRLSLIVLVLAVSATAVTASPKLFMFNGTNTMGFGYKANAATITYDAATTSFGAVETLPNKFTSAFVADSGAAVCNIGGGRVAYITIQTDSTLIGLCVAVVGPNGSEPEYVIETPFLPHHVACDPESTARVYLVVSDPYSPDVNVRMTFNATLYDFHSQQTVRNFGGVVFSVAAVDSCFSFSTTRTLAWLMQQSTSELFVNSGAISVVTTATGAVKSYAMVGYIPLQLDEATVSATSANGFAYQQDDDGGVAGIWYGEYALSSGSATFTPTAQLSAAASNQMYSGYPWWICSSFKLAFSVNWNNGDEHALVTALHLADGTIAATKKIVRGAGEQRIFGGLAGIC